MTADNLIERTLKDRNIQRALQAPAKGTIIGRIARILLIGFPDALLRRQERERQIELAAPGPSTVANLPTDIGKFYDVGHLVCLPDHLRRQPVLVPRHRPYRLILGWCLVRRATG